MRKLLGYYLALNLHFYSHSLSSDYVTFFYIYFLYIFLYSKKGLPWELLYADDLLLLAESRLELEKRLTEWMARLKEKELRVNIGKTKVMNCKVGVGQVENSCKYPCGVCRSGVGDNAIDCTSFKKGIYK